MIHQTITDREFENDFLALEEDRYEDIVYPIRNLKIKDSIRYKKAMSNALNTRKIERAAKHFIMQQTPKYKKYIKKYSQRPAVIAKRKEYAKRPAVIAKRKAYHERPEVIARNKKLQCSDKYVAIRKAYYKRPDVMARDKIRRSTEKFKARKKIYYQRPEVKKRNRETYLRRKELKRLDGEQTKREDAKDKQQSQTLDDNK